MQGYLTELNEQQRAAVTHTEGPLMIVAGAGSGKTKVLTTRIAHLINNRVDAFRILALTFTNKAAKEMVERIGKILGNNESKNLYIGTFHSVFAKILRFEATHMGYPSNFTIYDTDDAKNLLKTIIKEQNLDDKYYKPNLVYNRISAAKNSLMTPQMYKADPYIQKEDSRSGRQLIGDLYEIYANRCFKNGAMDFDDLLLKTYQLLVSFPEVLAKYQNRFRYIMIDEYQDTNMAQYKIIKLLGAVHENICVVGDDAQSIYSFRGATIENILKFKDDYEDVKVIKLEQNYRSTHNIIAAANTIIDNNKNQIPKKLWTEKAPGDKLKVVKTVTDNDEGRFVADSIAEQKLRFHYKNSDFAILYRTNSQSRSFEESLRRMAIPYRIYGGLSFYQRKEIKDFIAYLRILVNQRDDEALKRIINYPVRGIGKTTIEHLLIFADKLQISFWEALTRVSESGLSAAAARKVTDFVTMIQSMQTMLQKSNAYEVAFELGKHSGIVKDLHNDKTVEGVARYENIQELLNSIKEFTETPNVDGELEEDKSLGAYLQQITLLTDADNDKADKDVVTLMTIHAAKGLEFPCVYTVGIEENIFPSAMSLYDRDDLEEERRLFYVAITRAKEKLWLTYAQSRYRFGSLISNDASRFLQELPLQYIDDSQAGKSVARATQLMQSNVRTTIHAKSTSNTATQRSSVVQRPANISTYEHTPNPNFAPTDPSLLEVGMRVEHQKFGFGNISKIEGNVQNRIAHIQFEQGVGEKRIMLNFAKLMKV